MADKTTAQAPDTATAVAVSLLDQLRAKPVVREKFDDQTPWLPQTAGEGLEGYLVRIGQFHDDSYSEKVLTTWTVEDDHGTKWSVIPFHKMLRGEMAKSRANVGDRVAILYDGEEPSETDPTISFKLYRVISQRPRRN